MTQDNLRVDMQTRGKNIQDIVGTFESGVIGGDGGDGGDDDKGKNTLA